MCKGLTMISPTLQLKGVSRGPPSRWTLRQTSLSVQSPSSNCEHLHRGDAAGRQRGQGFRDNFISKEAC